jgi:RNA polymerase sigma factor (sigma-70 family)
MNAETGHNPEELDDAALVRLCVEGDEAALAALVRRYQRLVYSIPLRHGLRPEAAADVFQSVWLRLIEKLPSIREPASIGAWLITTATRECWRAADRSRREAPIEGRGESDTPSAMLDLPDPKPLAEEEQLLIELQHRVRAALARLPERCRRLLELLFYEDEPVSYAEIARQLGMSVDSVGPTRTRCIGKLRRVMDELERRAGGRR